MNTLPTTRLYHLVATVERTGQQIQLSGYPMPHADACTMKSKQVPHNHLRYSLVYA